MQCKYQQFGCYIKHSVCHSRHKRESSAKPLNLTLWIPVFTGMTMNCISFMSQLLTQLFFKLEVGC